MKRYSLVGVDGNAFAVMGYVTQAMTDAYVDAKERHNEEYEKFFCEEAQDCYCDKAMSGDYNNLLSLSAKMIYKVNDYFRSKRGI